MTETSITSDQAAVDTTPSTEIESVVGPLKSARIKSGKRGRPRGRPPKRGRPIKKSVSKSRRKKKKKTEKVIELPNVYESPPGKLIPTSLLNFILFTVIFGVLVAAQISIKMNEERTIPLSITPVVITAEEDVGLGETVEVSEETAVELPAAAEGETTGVEPAGAEVVEKTEIEAGGKAEVKASEEVVGEKVAEEVKPVPPVEEKAEEKVKEKVIEKKIVKKTRSQYYRPDAYTSGGSLDLDGPESRQKYLAGNVVLVPKSSDASGAKGPVKESKPADSMEARRERPVDREYADDLDLR